MVRTKGAEGKPKTTEYFIKKLQESAAKEGLELTVEMKDKVVTAAENTAQQAGQSVEEIAAAGKAARERFHKLELELDNDEIDTYECGNCHTEMGSKLSKCPECGAGLNW
ncbi:hypothetical protein CL622_05670 [archaeon]|nr:hypothetical protein [archaeon]|tara:strand:- start:477 stop:806 length:330 start_codon:yes stop_codon:yes gene_type:complete